MWFPIVWMCAQLNTFHLSNKCRTLAAALYRGKERERERDSKNWERWNKFCEYMQFTFVWRRHCSEIKEYEKKKLIYNSLWISTAFCTVQILPRYEWREWEKNDNKKRGCYAIDTLNASYCAPNRYHCATLLGGLVDARPTPSMLQKRIAKRSRKLPFIIEYMWVVEVTLKAHENLLFIFARVCGGIVEVLCFCWHRRDLRINHKSSQILF